MIKFLFAKVSYERTTINIANRLPTVCRMEIISDKKFKHVTRVLRASYRIVASRRDTPRGNHRQPTNTTTHDPPARGNLYGTAV